MFWRVSARQMKAIISGAQDRMLREHNERAWLAWHTAALMRAKKMPNIKKLMSKAPGRTAQTWQQQMAVMDQWVAHTAQVMRQRKKR